MKAVILCGGKGRRIGSAEVALPKALMQINGHPMISYVIERYLCAGISDIILCVGTLSSVMYEYYNSHCGLRLGVGRYSCQSPFSHREYNLVLIDSGNDAGTGDRLLSALPYLDEDFFVSYCDCISDIDIEKLKAAHFTSGGVITMAVTNPISQYGIAILEGNYAVKFQEKPVLYNTWVNAGFMAVSKKIAPYLMSQHQSRSIERDVIPQLVEERLVAVYRHVGYWNSVETKKDLEFVELLLSTGGQY